MTQIFRLSGGVRRNRDVDAWFLADGHELRRTVQPWFEAMRACGPDVTDLLHDGHPVACVGDAAFAYVDAFSGHANVGFFHGAGLEDPSDLLEGTGKRMRHVKLHWGRPIDGGAMKALITAGYRDIRSRLERPD